MIQIGNGKSRITAWFLVAFLIPAAANAEASPVDGTWIIRDLVLHIFDCEQSVCGRIVWLKHRPGSQPAWNTFSQRTWLELSSASATSVVHTRLRSIMRANEHSDMS